MSATPLILNGFQVVVYIEEDRLDATPTAILAKGPHMVAIMNSHRPLTAATRFTVVWREEVTEAGNALRSTFATLHSIGREGEESTFVGTRRYSPGIDTVNPTLSGYCSGASQESNQLSLDLRIYTEGEPMPAEDGRRTLLATFNVIVKGPETMAQAFKTLHDPKDATGMPVRGIAGLSNTGQEGFNPSVQDRNELLDRLKSAQGLNLHLRERAEEEYLRAQYFEGAVDKLYHHLPPCQVIAYLDTRIKNEQLSPTMRVSVAKAKEAELSKLQVLSDEVLDFEIQCMLAACLGPVLPATQAQAVDSSQQPESAEVGGAMVQDD